METKLDAESIVKKYCKKLKQIDTDQRIAKVVKNIDNIVQEMYVQLYTLNDPRRAIELNKSNKSGKKGHCC
jgi:hypothetical protein